MPPTSEAVALAEKVAREAAVAEKVALAVALLGQPRWLALGGYDVRAQREGGNREPGVVRVTSHGRSYRLVVEEVERGC